ncbi:hypothetical protein [Swingsia samuiensis]|uniref:Uncharacterized protein n=1 Tax=Swingsia samuiensis TaxID=1293412 RepID=A0A4Y6UGU1_9PROT|nr:hypothetical protein [Swingsia samuiensis]QDH16789.1 hypothetical protein E3D00_03800 [Swingsia samuiensis]
MEQHISVSSDELNESEKVDIRRFCGYPVIGSCDTSQGSWRFFQQEGTLEWRMNHLSSSERQQVRGYIAQLEAMELALAHSSDNLDTERAASWFHNQNEVSDRLQLFWIWRKRFCTFLGVSGGSELQMAQEISI